MIVSGDVTTAGDGVVTTVGSGRYSMKIGSCASSDSPLYDCR